MVKFVMERIMTGWCKTKSDSGVRHGCPLSPLLFNIIYVSEFGMTVAKCFKYLMVNKEGGIEVKSLYADDLCLMAGNEQDMQTIFDNISG